MIMFRITVQFEYFRSARDARSVQPGRVLARKLASGVTVTVWRDGIRLGVRQLRVGGHGRARPGSVSEPEPLEL